MVTEQDVENARRGYALVNEAYRHGDVQPLRAYLEEFWDPDVVFEPAGILPESRPAHGRDGVLRYTEEQMKAFSDGTMFIQPLEYIAADDRLVVPFRIGGRGRHTDIEVDLEFVHVIELRDGKCVRMNAYGSLTDAFAALGISDEQQAELVHAPA